MRPGVPRGAAAALLACIVACGSTTIVLPATFDDGGIARRAWRPVGCPLQLSGVVDLRSDPAALGALGPTPVRAEDFAAWVRGGIAARLDAAGHVGGEPLGLDVQILKAYAQAVAMSKSVDIVLRVHYLRAGERLGEGTYRGSATALNWSGSADEIRGTFAMALADAVDQARAGSATFCGPAPPAT